MGNWSCGRAARAPEFHLHIPACVPFGSTAPLADLQESSMQHLISVGWPENQLDRRRLLGRDIDEKFNVLKEWLNIANLLERKVELHYAVCIALSVTAQ